jgi:hypothetical protein
MDRQMLKKCFSFPVVFPGARWRQGHVGAGIDFTKLNFGQKLFRLFYPQILDNFSPPNR